MVASEQGGYTVPKAPFARWCLKTGTGVIPRPWLDDRDRLGLMKISNGIVLG